MNHCYVKAVVGGVVVFGCPNSWTTHRSKATAWHENVAKNIAKSLCLMGISAWTVLDKSQDKNGDKNE